MVLKSFYINILVRVALIVASAVLTGIVLQQVEQGYYYTLSGMISLIAIQSILLVNQVNRTNADLEKFFSSVTDQDSSIRFSKAIRSRSFISLRNRMNDVISSLSRIKTENEKIRQFLQTVVDHVDVGLLAFDQDNKILIYNKAAGKYFKAGNMEVLKINSPEIYSFIHEIRPGHEILHKFSMDNQVQNVLIKSGEIKLEDRVVKLISFENITRELDRKEVDSWQRLIRVLTHEIMNSVSPITSLTSVISGYYKESNEIKKSAEISDRIVMKTLEGLNTIEETGKGLLEFVNKYRSFTSLPVPKIVAFKIASLFGSCKMLMESNVPANIRIVEKIQPNDLTMEADYTQVEQVLINLVKNAIEALNQKKDGLIHLTALNDDQHIIIQIEDNGPGIPDAILEDIFVPFYTTKPDGSGIGLSLSKQIMQNHNGTISAVSDVKGTIITLTFNKPLNAI
jgi:nitrogen fixation/metabolism regulation signal transduction histidine kinase